MLLAGISGVILGVILNSWLRSRENNNFLETLIKEFNKLQDKAKVSALTAEEQRQMDKLDSEIYIMKFKCIA